MNLYEAAAVIDAAADILRADNDSAERIAFWRSEVARLEAIAATKPSGTAEMRVANIRIGCAEFALLRLERDESARLA